MLICYYGGVGLGCPGFKGSRVPPDLHMQPWMLGRKEREERQMSTAAQKPRTTSWELQMLYSGNRA